MAEEIREVRETAVAPDGNRVQSVKTVSDSRTDKAYRANMAERIVWFIGGTIMSLLALRFLLSLLGANRENGFANLIYSLSYPFAAPFFGLFNYQTEYGVSRFEFETLIAILVWGLLTLAVAKLVTLGQRSSRDNI